MTTSSSNTNTRKRSNGAAPIVIEATAVEPATSVVPAEVPVATSKAIPVAPVQTTRPSGLDELLKALPLLGTASHQHWQQCHHLLSGRFSREMTCSARSGHLWQHWLDNATWQEWQQLQHAAMQRLQQQQDNWLRGCAALIEEYAQLKRANTLSKLVEQQCNVLAQFQLLLSNQASNMLELQDNIEVSYGYWLSQKLAD